MITYWQQEDGKFKRIKEEELDSQKRTWVDARIVTRDDVEILQNEYKIDPEHILDILDPDEQSRLEDGDDYLLTIIRLPIFEPLSDPQYLTCPLGIVIKDRYPIKWKNSELPKKNCHILISALHHCAHNNVPNERYRKSFPNL